MIIAAIIIICSIQFQTRGGLLFYFGAVLLIDFGAHLRKNWKISYVLFAFKVIVCTCICECVRFFCVAMALLPLKCTFWALFTPFKHHTRENASFDNPNSKKRLREGEWGMKRGRKSLCTNCFTRESRREQTTANSISNSIRISYYETMHKFSVLIFPQTRKGKSCGRKNKTKTKINANVNCIYVRNDLKSRKRAKSGVSNAFGWSGVCMMEWISALPSHVCVWAHPCICVANCLHVVYALCAVHALPVSHRTHTHTYDSSMLDMRKHLNFLYNMCTEWQMDWLSIRIVCTLHTSTLYYRMTHIIITQALFSATQLKSKIRKKTNANKTKEEKLW